MGARHPLITFALTLQSFYSPIFLVRKDIKSHCNIKPSASNFMKQLMYIFFLQLFRAHDGQPRHQVQSQLHELTQVLAKARGEVTVVVVERVRQVVALGMASDSQWLYSPASRIATSLYVKKENYYEPYHQYTHWNGRSESWSPCFTCLSSLTNSTTHSQTHHSLQIYTTLTETIFINLVKKKEETLIKIQSQMPWTIAWP